MGFQDGQTKVINGITYVRQGGVWRSQTPVAPAKQPAPQTAAQATQDELNVEKLRSDLGRAPIQNAKDREELRGAVIENTNKERGVLKPGYRWSADGTAAEPIPGIKQEGEDERQGRISRLNALRAQIDRVEELYRQGPGATKGPAGLVDYLPTSTNKQFDVAGAQLSQQGMAAFRIPGQGTVSDRDAEMFDRANLPSASTYDAAVEEQLRGLRARVEEEYRALGIEPPSEVSPQQVSTPSPAMEAATTQKTVVDPTLTPIRREYIARLAAGQSGSQLVAFLRKAGITDPALLQAAAAQAKHRRENPGTPIEAYDAAAIDHITKYMSRTNQVLNNVGQSEVGTAIAHAGNAVTGNNLDSIIGMTGGNPEQARLALEYSARDNPTSALAGEIIGGTTAALGGEAALARLGMAGGFGRALAADSSYGAVAGAGASDDGNRLLGALGGATIGAAASGAAQGAFRGASRIARGADNPDARKLVSEGIDGLSVGQAAGGAVKKWEDKATSIPLLGDAINSQRREAYQQFNAKAFDKALEPIGGTVNGQVGEAAVSAARDQVSEAFNKALGGKSFSVDVEFGKAARGPIERLASIKRDGIGQEIVGRIEEATAGYFDEAGNLTGENYQALLESLREIRQSYRNDPLAKRINDAVKGFESALEGMVTRSDPSVVPQFKAAKGAYRRLSTLADAVNAGKNTDGMFSTGQLGMADRANAKKYDGALNAASGSSPFHDFQRAAQNVLPSTVPDSGTGGRLALMAVPGVLGGGADQVFGEGAGTGTQVGLGLSGALALLYSRTGQRKLVERILKENPILADKLAKRARLAGAGSASLALGTSLDQ